MQNDKDGYRERNTKDFMKDKRYEEMCENKYKRKENEILPVKGAHYVTQSEHIKPIGGRQKFWAAVVQITHAEQSPNLT